MSNNHFIHTDSLQNTSADPRRASLDKLSARAAHTPVLDREGFEQALAHIAQHPGNTDWLRLPVTEQGLADHFGFEPAAPMRWEQALPVLEGMLWVPDDQHGLFHALLAGRELASEAALCVRDLPIELFEQGQRASLLQGAGFVRGELLGLWRGIAADDEEGDPLTLRVKLVLPLTARLCAYRLDTAWGGPEEGGWHYDTGELIEAWTTTPDTYAFQHDLMMQLIRAGHIEASELQLHYRTPPSHWPTRRPRYC